MTRTRVCGQAGRSRPAVARTANGIWVARPDGDAVRPGRQATQSCVSIGTCWTGGLVKTSSKTWSACGEAGLDVALAELEVVADVRARLGVDDDVGEGLAEPRAARRGRAGRRGPGPPSSVEDRRQLLVLDLDQVERRLGGVEVDGRDGRDRLADEADLVDGQDRPGRGRSGRSTGRGRPRAARSAPVRTAQTPGSGPGPGGVDADDPGVGVGAAQELRVEHPRHPDVDRVRHPAADAQLARRACPGPVADLGARWRERRDRCPSPAAQRSPAGAAAAARADSIARADPDPDHLGPVPGRAAHVVERVDPLGVARRRPRAMTSGVEALADARVASTSGKRCGVSAAAPTATRRSAQRAVRREADDGGDADTRPVLGRCGSRTCGRPCRCRPAGSGPRTPVTISSGASAVS